MRQVKIPVYVVSLRQDQERRAVLRAQFGNEYGSFSIIDATDRVDDSISKIISKDLLFGYGSGKEMSRAEMACSLSHVRALGEFLATGKDRCIVLEDDVLGCPEDLSMARDVATSVCGDGVVLLGGQESLRTNRHLWGRATEVDGVFEIPGLARRFFLRTCCYAISSQAAAEIVRRQRLALRRADDWRRILPRDCPMHFVKIFRHPDLLGHSHIERDRQNRGELGSWKRMFADGLRETLVHNFTKLAFATLGPATGLERIEPSSRKT